MAQKTDVRTVTALAKQISSARNVKWIYVWIKILAVTNSITNSKYSFRNGNIMYVQNKQFIMDILFQLDDNSLLFLLK